MPVEGRELRDGRIVVLAVDGDGFIYSVSTYDSGNDDGPIRSAQLFSCLIFREVYVGIGYHKSSSIRNSVGFSEVIPIAAIIDSAFLTAISFASWVTITSGTASPPPFAV